MPTRSSPVDFKSLQHQTTIISSTAVVDQSIVIVGIGEVGGVFARAFLSAGYPVHPVVRGTNQSEVSRILSKPQLVLLCVGERDLHPVLRDLPACWRDRTGLLQNELLPRDWRPYNLSSPTVISVWFEKKKGKEVRVVVPSPLFGPGAGLVQQALDRMDIPSMVVPDEEKMLFELIRKNLYILVTNLCGLRTGGTVGELWANHEAFARAVASDVLDIQQALTERELDREKLITAMLVAFNGDPRHGCLGRTAEQRLQRAIEYGDAYALELPTLRKISQQV